MTRGICSYCKRLLWIGAPHEDDCRRPRLSLAEIVKKLKEGK